MTILTVRPYKMSNSSSDTDCYFSDAETIIGSQIVHDYNHNVSDLEFSDSTDDSSLSGASSEGMPADDASWKKNVSAVKCDDFLGPLPGPTTVLPAEANELDFFHLLMKFGIFEHIAEETNRYAEDKIKAKPDRKWRSVSVEEVKAYIGYKIVTGVVSVPNSLYFTKDSLFHSTGISEKFTRDRLDKIGQYFHVCDNSDNPARGNDGHDKLSHVRGIITHLKDNIMEQYNPHPETTIDEAMIGYSGRLSIVQYLPLKPIKRGIKVWMRADPHNGYVNDFNFYTGKDRAGPQKGLAERVVKDLVEPIYGLNHIVYMDNFFSSVPLYTHLLSQGTYACGTFRRGRCGVPDEVSNAKLKNQGQFIQMQKGNLVASAWHDKRTVLILSTNSDPTALCSVDRHLKSGAAIQVPCPESLKNYTLYMNGVDHHDQLRSAYGIKKKALKWWKYAFFFLVDVAICNSYLLMCESDNHVIMTRGNRSRKRTQLEYRIQLAHLLMKDFSMKRRLVQPNVQDTPFAHWAISAKKGRCKLCSLQKKRHESRMACEQCKVSLCLDCFKPYHMRTYPGMF